MAETVTDQAIAKIKELIISGEFSAGAKLPREAALAARLGLSRNSLREAVRALTLIGVLDARVGDGTYVTSLEPGVLLMGMGFVGDLLDGRTLLEVHQVRRILEPAATALAAPRLTEDDFDRLQDCLRRMEQAEADAPGQAEHSEAFIEADTEFHRIINGAAGNATLASIIQNLSGGMLRARLWRTASERGAGTTACQRHRDIFNALRERDAAQASAADLIHLIDGERWLAQRIGADGALEPLLAARPDDGSSPRPADGAS